MKKVWRQETNQMLKFSEYPLLATIGADDDLLVDMTIETVNIVYVA